MSSLISKIEDLVDRAFEFLDRYDWRTAKKIAARVLFAFVAAASILYAAGVWDFTFIKRPEPKPGHSQIGNTPTQDSDTDTPPDVPSGDSTPDPAPAPGSNPDPGPDANPPSKADPVSAQIYHMSELCNEGYYVTSRNYDPAVHKIAIMNLSLGAPKEYSVRERNVYTPSFDYEYTYGEAKVKYVLTAEARPSLEAYGGYLFADNGTGVLIFDSYGHYITSYNENMFFAYTRDSEGNPLFYTPSTFRVYDKYQEYYTDVDTKTYFALTPGGIFPSDYIDEINSRGVHADLPASYGTQSEPYNRSVIVSIASKTDLRGRMSGWRRTLWGFTAPDEDEPFTFGWYDPEKLAAEREENEGGDAEQDEPKLSAAERFALAVKKEEDWNNTPSHAFNYSEGYACVANEKGQMWFIDRSGETLFETKDIHCYNAVGRPVVDNYLLPLTNGIESLGFYYFDHGLVRVRRQSYDYLQVEDWDILRPEYDDDELVYADGTKFSLAEGYDIISYSDGMILLEKNGKYGYMDYTGAWIVQPELGGAKPFIEGLAPIMRDGRWGVIDTSGNTVIPFNYDSIQTTSSGMIVCHRDAGWTVFAKMTTNG